MVALLNIIPVYTRRGFFFVGFFFLVVLGCAAGLVAMLGK